MIKPELEFVYEAGARLDAPREIGTVYDGTRRIIPIVTGGYVKGPKISGRLMGNSADWQLTRADGVTVADALYAIETDDGALIQIRNKGLRHGPPEVMDRLRARRGGRPGRVLLPHGARVHRRPRARTTGSTSRSSSAPGRATPEQHQAVRVMAGDLTPAYFAPGSTTP